MTIDQESFWLGYSTALHLLENNAAISEPVWRVRTNQATLADLKGRRVVFAEVSGSPRTIDIYAPARIGVEA